MTAGTKSFGVLVAAALSGLLAGGSCGRGGELQGTGGAGAVNVSGNGGGQIMTGSGGTATTGVGGGMDCAGNPIRVQALAPDILIVLDTSASMNDGFDSACAGGCGAASKWAAAAASIGAVVTPPSRATWGLKLLADGADACDAGGIDVPVGTGSTAIKDALARRSLPPGLAMPGNTPTRGAIEVAAALLSARDRRPQRIILLVTDAPPDCGPGAADPLASDGDGTVQAIAEAAVTGITTDVVGLATGGGSADETLARMATAGAIAPAGPSSYVSVSGDADLLRALNNVVANNAGCRFAVPDPPTNDGTTSRSDILVQFEQGDLPDQPVPRDVSNGWSYTDASMTAIQLFGPACDTARGGSPVSIIFNCHD